MEGMCPACGTTTAERARFCHACGASVEAVLIDLEAAPTEDATARSSRWGKLVLAGGAAAVLALVAALLFLGESDPAEEADAPSGVPAPTPLPPEPTPDEQAEQVAAEPAPTPTPAPRAERAEPLTFTYQADLGVGWPMAIETVGDTTFVAATPGLPGFQGAPGLVLWRRMAGGAFESLGTQLTEATVVTGTTSTDDELLVIGNAADGALTIWRTTDGSSWTTDRITAGGSATAITVHEGTTYVAAGDVSLSPFRIPAPPLGDPRLTWSYDADRDGFRAVAMAPLGLPLVSLTAEEAGVTAEDMAALGDRPGSDEMAVWSNADETWRASSVPAFWVGSLVVTPDGRLLATGNGRNGEAAWIRDDADTWDAVNIGFAERVFRSDSGGLQGVRVGGVGSSVDGVSDWMWLDIDRLVPGTSEVFLSHPTSDGTTLTATVDALEADSDGRPTPVVFVKDDYTLHLDLDDGLLRLRADAADLAVIELWNSELDPSRFVGDIEAGTVTFIDPRTGGPGPTLDFDELIAMRSAALEGLERPTFALATTDGRSFHVTPTAEFLPIEHELDLLAAEGDTIVAVVVTNSGFDTVDPPGLEIWTAPLPRSGRLTGALPDGTRFELVGDAAWARGPVEDISAAIRVELSDGTSPVAGVATFRRRRGDTAAVTDDHYSARAGAWRFDLDLYPDVVQALGPDSSQLLRESIATSLDSGVPVIELAPPFRWADDADTPLQMEVSAGWITIRRGCGDGALVCSPGGEIQAVFGRDVDRLVGPDLELRVVPGPPGT